MSINPETALIDWQITMLHVLKNYPGLPKEHKAEIILLTEQELRDIGLEPIGREAQRKAIESLNDELIVYPIYETGYLPDGQQYDLKSRAPQGYEITMLDDDPYGELDRLIEAKIARKKGIKAVNIQYKVDEDMAAIIVNDFRIEAHGGTWQYAIIKSLHDAGVEGRTHAKRGDIEELKDNPDMSDKSNFMRKEVATLSKKIERATGLPQLVKGNSVVKLNQVDYRITLAK